MAIHIPSSESGKGVSFYPGSPNNVFGATSGVFVKNGQLPVQPAQTLSAALAVLQDYGASHSSWLTEYENDVDKEVLLYYIVSSNPVISIYSRSQGAWAPKSYITTIPGKDGSGTDFGNIPANHVPAINASHNPFDSGMRVDPETGLVTMPANVTLDGGTLYLSGGTSVSDGAGWVVTHSEDNNTDYYLIDSLFSTAGSNRPRWKSLQAEESVTVYSGAASNISGSSLTFQIPWDQMENINALTFKYSAAMSNFRFTVADSHSGVIYYKFPSSIDIENGTGIPVAAPSGASGDLVIRNYSDSPGASSRFPIAASALYPLTVKVMADNLALLGNGSNPYLVKARQKATEYDIAIDSDITASAIVSKLESLATPNKLPFTAIDGKVLNSQLAYMNPFTLKGNNSSNPAAEPQDISAFNVKTMLSLDQVENVDQTNASNITSGTLDIARLGSATGLPEKGTPVAADIVMGQDSANSFAKVKYTMADLARYMSGSQTTIYNSVLYVSGAGDDGNNGYTPETSKATLGAAATTLANTRGQIAVHPYIYNGDYTLANTNLTLTAINGDNGNSVYFNGTLTLNHPSGTMFLQGLDIVKLVIQGNGNVFLNNCDIATVEKNGTGSFEATNCSFNSGTGTVNVSNRGNVVFNGSCWLGKLNITDSQALVIIDTSPSCGVITMSGGKLYLCGGSYVYNSATSTYALNVTGGNVYLDDVHFHKLDNTLAPISVVSPAVLSKRVCFYDEATSVNTATVSVEPLITDELHGALDASYLTGTISFNNFPLINSLNEKATLDDSDIFLIENALGGWAKAKATAADLWTYIRNKTAFQNVVYLSTSGNDSYTGDSPDTAVLTLTKALTLAGNSGRQICVYPGTYAGNYSITNQNVSITGINSEKGGLINFTGTMTFNHAASSIRMNGISVANIVHSGAGNLYLYNCFVQTMQKTGGGYFEANQVDFQNGAATTSITGSGISNFLSGCKTSTMTINNASAIVNFTSTASSYPITQTSGNLVISSSTVFATSETTNAITLNGGSAQFNDFKALTPTGLPARISIASGVVYTNNSASYDPVNSTISGTNVPGLLIADRIVGAIDASQITGGIPNSKLATMPANTVKANLTGSAAVPADATMASLKTALAVKTTELADFSATVATAGQVPVWDNGTSKYNPTTVVNSFNGRTGAIVPALGDYTASQVGSVPAFIGANVGALVKVTATGANTTTVADSGVSVSTDGTFAGATDTKLPTALAVQTYVQNTVQGQNQLQGSWTPVSQTSFPTQSKTGGAITLGMYWLVSASGTFAGQKFTAGDYLTAMVNNPSGTVYAGNWANSSNNTFAGLNDVTFSTLSANQIPKYDGTKWINGSINSTMIDPATISNVNLAVAPAYTMKGNITDSPASPADVTLSNLKTALSIKTTDLTDISTTAPTNGQVLIWNSSSNKYEPGNGGAGGGIPTFTGTNGNLPAIATNGTTLTDSTIKSSDVLDNYSAAQANELNRLYIDRSVALQFVPREYGSQLFPFESIQNAIDFATNPFNTTGQYEFYIRNGKGITLYNYYETISIVDSNYTRKSYNFVGELEMNRPFISGSISIQQTNTNVNYIGVENLQIDSAASAAVFLNVNANNVVVRNVAITSTIGTSPVVINGTLSSSTVVVIDGIDLSNSTTKSINFNWAATSVAATVYLKNLNNILINITGNIPNVTFKLDNSTCSGISLAGGGNYNFVNYNMPIVQTVSAASTASQVPSAQAVFNGINTLAGVGYWYSRLNTISFSGSVGGNTGGMYGYGTNYGFEYASDASLAKLTAINTKYQQTGLLTANETVISSTPIQAAFITASVSSVLPLLRLKGGKNYLIEAFFSPYFTGAANTYCQFKLDLMGTTNATLPSSLFIGNTAVWYFGSGNSIPATTGSCSAIFAGSSFSSSQYVYIGVNVSNNSNASYLTANNSGYLKVTLLPG